MIGNVERAVAIHIWRTVVFLRFGGRVLACLAAHLAHFEQRVGFERFAYESLDLKIGQRQQLDRLLQLRRHHQRLGLPEIEARTQRHWSVPQGCRHHSVKLSPR